uniref:UDENN domain-containing protein n=1 Tax=Laticauda laticaudata TaxID=8630 RepID=A0A8C5S5G9_LATLA
MDELLSSTAVLEVCVLVGVSREKARDARQLAQQKDVRTILLEPEVLSVFVPPFIIKEDLQALPLKSNALNKTKRRSFRKRKDKFKTEESKAVNGAPKTPEDEDITVPNDVDLNGLPQLCFPGGFYITGESRENHFHFLVFTDVFGNRTYGVVAQYYQPMQEGRLYNGQAHWDNLQSTRADSYFVPFAVCVISRYPYFNALKDCLSW